ncbi:hypothetical protein N4T77_02485 [Clostridium sp. CX1]|uniref:Uncharacterized protein n=1 Tax=Clostridium tanneri TaxID=3037988 RepID=A0ABU4JVH0_9CLOT|nr:MULTISPECIES: hypothetical protein [unclassified Clostridium]MCT8975457.1 hypothetical protein [Clostridium sp. CX1]MDW8801923.1 hypothetical protein [Clostridium sp. A1-XYC3]
MPQGRKTSKDDMILSSPSITESLGNTTSAGLTDGLTGDKPLLPNYINSEDSSNPNRETKIKTKTKKL